MSKKKVVKKNTEPKTATTNVAINTIEVKEEETKAVKPKTVEPTIFDKHRKHIETVKEGYLKKLTYAEAMEILRYVQDKTGHKLGLNMSCANCLVELVEIFAGLEGK